MNNRPGAKSLGYSLSGDFFFCTIIKNRIPLQIQDISGSFRINLSLIGKIRDHRPSIDPCKSHPEQESLRIQSFQKRQDYLPEDPMDFFSLSGYRMH